MSSRNSDFHTGTVGRLSPAKFDQIPRHNPMRPETYPSFRDTLSPPSDSSTSPATPPRCITPPHPRNFSKTKHTPGAKSLSVYELPTATFMWPRWDPRAEPESESRIYVRYRHPTSDTDSNSTYSTSTHSRPHSPASHMITSSHSSPASTPPPLPYSRKRSSSAESDDGSVTSPSDRLLKLPRISHNNAPSRAISAHSATPSVGPPETTTYPTRVGDKEATRVYHTTSGAESDSSDVELRPATFFYPAHQSNSTRGVVTFTRLMPPIAPPASAVLALREEEEEGDEEDLKNLWIKYTYPSPETSAGPDFHCTWQEKLRDGTSKPCGYRSKKHLVKRHIESKHLQLRPCKCEYCGKGFSQKSNLDTHLNTHTGIAPHKCHYCDEYFKDPARRHRHMIQAHQHRSSRTKKGRMGLDAGPGSSAEASEPDIEDVTTPPPA